MTLLYNAAIADIDAQHQAKEHRLHVCPLFLDRLNMTRDGLILSAACRSKNQPWSVQFRAEPASSPPAAIGSANTEACGVILMRSLAMRCTCIGRAPYSSLLAFLHTTSLAI